MPEQFVFRDLRDLLAKANEEKSGDHLAGLAARSERERVAAKRKLADLSLAEIAAQPVIDPDEDDVSRLLVETFDRERFRRIESLTVGEFREFLLEDSTTEEQLREIQWAIVPEIAAAAAKIMSNKDLVLAASKIRNITRCRNTMGERGVLGIRIQPNHPVDDIGGILLAAFEGLLFGCGDAVMLNYQSTSYHDALAARKLFHLRPAPEFLAWLQAMGIFRDAEPAMLDAAARSQLMQGLESSLGEIA